MNSQDQALLYKRLQSPLHDISRPAHDTYGTHRSPPGASSADEATSPNPLHLKVKDCIESHMWRTPLRRTSHICGSFSWGGAHISRYITAACSRFHARNKMDAWVLLSDIHSDSQLLVLIPIQLGKSTDRPHLRPRSSRDGRRTTLGPGPGRAHYYKAGVWRTHTDAYTHCICLCVFRHFVQLHEALNPFANHIIVSKRNMSSIIGEWLRAEVEPQPIPKVVTEPSRLSHYSTHVSKQEATSEDASLTELLLH